MFLNIRDMEVRPILFELTYPPGEIDFLDSNLRQTGDLRVEGKAELLGSVMEIRIRGRFQVAIDSSCERCLELAEFAIDRRFDLYYSPLEASPDAGEVALKAGEIELAFYEGEGLDLTDVLREQVLLTLPMQRVCRADCKGLCPVCGVNRNQESCSCEVNVADERWSALRKLSVR
jgi:uncharacterized protein